MDPDPKSPKSTSYGLLPCSRKTLSKNKNFLNILTSLDISSVVFRGKFLEFFSCLTLFQKNIYIFIIDTDISSGSFIRFGSSPKLTHSI